MVIVTIYIGAIAIFFLFVLMFINIPFILKKMTKLDKYFFILFFFLIFYFWLNILPINFFFFFDSEFLNYQIPDIIELEFLDYTDTISILSFFLYGYCSIFVICLGFLLYMTLVSTLFIILQDEIKINN
jgi:NADH:ubiquinone oxidoreductase subunit 6 (subunit J)